jgi:hypothetical protein
VKFCGTSQINTFPSSEAEAMIRSLNGFLHPNMSAILLESRGGGFDHVPVGIENSGCVSSKQRDLVGQLASFVQGNDCECAAARGVPVD